MKACTLAPRMQRAGSAASTWASSRRARARDRPARPGARVRRSPERACAERRGTRGRTRSARARGSERAFQQARGARRLEKARSARAQSVLGRARSSERAFQDAGGARRSERAPGARAQSASGRAHRPGARVREPARPAGARASSLPLPSRTATQWRRPFPRRGPSPTYSLTWTASFWVRSLRPPPAKTVQGKVREGRRLPGPAPRGGRRAWRRRGPDASRDSHFRRPRVGTEYAGAGA